MKAWYLYIVIVFQSGPITGPLAPVEQKTVILGFDHGRECMSIARQVDEQTQAPGVPFKLSVIQCMTCNELYGNLCRGVKSKP